MFVSSASCEYTCSVVVQLSLFELSGLCSNMIYKYAIMLGVFETSNRYKQCQNCCTGGVHCSSYLSNWKAIVNDDTCRQYAGYSDHAIT